jgi:uncharacterized membrane protein
MSKHKTLLIKDMTITAVFTALVFAATSIYIPFTDGGIIHFGNVPLITAAILFGKNKGAFAGAVGMTLFNLLNPLAHWAPYTFVISGAQGYITGLIAEKLSGNRNAVNITAITAGGVIRVAGYYLAGIVVLGGPILPLQAVPVNIMQIVLAGAVTIPLLGKLKKGV